MEIDHLNCVTVHIGCGEWGALWFGEMTFYPQWEYCVEVSQPQHLLHQCVPKKYVLLIFGDLLTVNE